MDFLNEISNIDGIFDKLLKENDLYYSNKLNVIKSNIINNFAEIVINDFHLKMYKVFNNLIDDNLNREELDFYFMDYLDKFFESYESEINVYNENDLKILKAIIELAEVLLENASVKKDSDSLLNSFFDLKNKLEDNNFVKSEHDILNVSKNNLSVDVEYNDNKLHGNNYIEIGVKYVD